MAEQEKLTLETTKGNIVIELRPDLAPKHVERIKRLVGEGLNELAARLGFRCTDGFTERIIFREFFPRGLSAVDELEEETLGTRPTLSHLSARKEVTQLLDALRLPLDERGRRRAAARAEWFSVQTRPLQLHDILAD